MVGNVNIGAGMSYNSRAASLALAQVLVLNLLAVATATEYVVGGDLQWTFPPSTSWYEDVWAKNYTFKVGDALGTSSHFCY